MSPASSTTKMATFSTSTLSTETLQPYTCKWGRVTILEGDNYAVFASTCRATLISAGSWSIVTGASPRPGGSDANTIASRGWDDLNRRAISILNGSVHYSLRHRIDAFIEAEDTKGIWDELAKENRTNSVTYVGDLYKAFQQAKWDPKTQTIRAYLTYLEEIKVQLDGTARAITTNDLLWRVLLSIPDDEDKWVQCYQFCTEGNKDLAETVLTIQSYERRSASSAAVKGTPNAPATPIVVV